jgi:hypothetical protein
MASDCTAASIRDGVVEPMIGTMPAGCFSSQASMISQVSVS